MSPKFHGNFDGPNIREEFPRLPVSFSVPDRKQTFRFKKTARLFFSFRINLDL